MLNKWLYTRIDNSALIVFRMIFGALLTLESWGAILTGWVRRVFIEPEFTFNFIGFDFLQPLPGDGMIWYFFLMGLLGISVMLGLKYRLSILLYTLMWAGVYLMQKSSYNNHYYLLLLLCFLMTLLPANRYASLDVKMNPKIRKISMPRWGWLLLVIQMWIVYSYAAFAKLYADWFDGTFPKILMSTRQHYWLIGDFLQQSWVHHAIAWFGFLFDLLIIPLLLLKKTRIYAFWAAVFFHLFNSIVFQIGIFPYLALAFTLFFFPSQKINRIFLKNKPHYDKKEVQPQRHPKLLYVFLGFWFSVQVALPMRHWFFQDDVLWTEEGHRLSWRMMLRTKTGDTHFMVVDKAQPRDTINIRKSEYLSPKQQAALAAKPDMIWQFAQFLEQEYAKNDKKVEVYVKSRVSVNGRPYQAFIDPNVDLAAEEWRHFSHTPWILPYSED